MEINILNGHDIESDKKIILNNSDNPHIVYVLNNEAKPLNKYIDDLKLGDTVLMSLKICKEINDIDVMYTPAGKNEAKRFNRFSDLLKEMDLDTEAYVTVMGDKNADDGKKAAVRRDLSNVLQQLVYLDIPLGRIQVMTELEYDRIEQVKRFEKNIKKHWDNIVNSRNNIQWDKYPDYREISDKIDNSLSNIEKYLKAAVSSEIKIAVAASKKSGKSVIVNSMIGSELAPTSLELATPNNCIYKPSKNGKYTLTYNDGRNSNIEKSFDSSKDIKEFILPIFEKAQQDSEGGYGIPDMYIGYIAENTGLSSYTIYDTPGPDLARADAHKEAADRAIGEADIVIFAIDYSKYLTDTEEAYLKKIKGIMAENGKFYSLIICVNKLDTRYTSEGDKSVVRILDFIREKLRGFGPEYEDVVVMGTSSLTYFDCIEAVGIEGCEALKEETDLSYNLAACMKKYRGKPEMTVLSFLEDMVRRMGNFHDIDVNNIEELKYLSGMPNLLSHVEYIALNKARVEIVNSIMSKIDAEYTNIQNLFRLRELEEELMNNQASLEKARESLSRFRDAVKNIYSPDYSRDISYIMGIRDRSSISINLESVVNKIEKGEIDDTFSIDLLSREAVNRVEKNLKEEDVIDKYADGIIRSKLDKNLTVLYANAKERRGGKKAVPENDVFYEICFVIMNALTSNEITNEMNMELEFAYSYTRDECERIKNNMVDIINYRNSELQSAIDRLEDSLSRECGIPFSMEKLEIEFEFPYDTDTFKMPVFGYKWTFIGTLREELEYVLNTRKIYDHKGLLSGIRNWIDDNIVNKDYSVNKICYDKDYALSEAYDNRLKPIVKAEINNMLGNPYRDAKEDLKRIVKGFLREMNTEIEQQNQIGTDLAAEVQKTLDNTEEMKDNISELKRKQEFYHEMKICVDPFLTGWKDNARLS